MKPKTNYTLFNWIKEIIVDKRKWSSFGEDDRASFNAFMVHRYISMNKEYIDIANYIQTIPHGEKEKIYRIYCDMIPKKNVWLKYIKSSKKRTSDALLKYVVKEYTISLGEAEEYTYILGNKGIQEILNKLGYESK